MILILVMDAAIEARLSQRGGILQRQAHARPVTAHRSVLAKRLVELWSWGTISAPMLQWLVRYGSFSLLLFVFHIVVRGHAASISGRFLQHG